ncbi:MAG: beta-galactosidase [Bacteroidetes bacterium]|nr:beta-galactosidase [Bacteroidota bacterium]
MNQFRSYLMGGYECADHINRSGVRVNLLFETAHHSRVEEDYTLLAETPIRTVREGICWSYVEPVPGRYDFTEVGRRIAAAKAYGIQQVWDICHFGYPDGLIPTHPCFAARFAAVCEAFARYYRSQTDETLIVVPVNEISFLAWHSGDVRGTVPFAINSGFDIKYHLCKAAIAGIGALKVLDPSCRIMLVEPLIRIHAVHEHHTADVCRYNEDQYQAMDIIAGRMCPELGGREDYLDILGFNYYYNNQWLHAGETAYWPEVADYHCPLHELLREAYERYHRPIVLSETGHFGDGRAAWYDYVAHECRLAVGLGAELLGVCLYPLIGRPDWDDLSIYHDSGLWETDAHLERIVHEPLMQAIRCDGFTNEMLKDAISEESQKNRLLV